MTGLFFAWYLEEFSKVFLIYKYFFNLELNKSRNKVIITTIIVSSIAFGIFIMAGMKQNFTVETAFLGLIFLFTLVSFKEKLWMKLIMYFPVYSGICLIDMIVDSIRKLVLGELYYKGNGMLILLFFNGISIGIIAFLCFLKRVLKKDNKSIFGTWQMASLMAMLVVVTAFFIAYASVILSNEDTILNRVMYVVFAFVWILFVILSFVFLQSIWSKERYKLLLDMNENLLNQQQEYYQGLLEKDEKIRRFRHDYKGHLALIADMVEQRRYDEVKEYLDNINGVTDSLRVYRTGNDTVDIVLNDIASKYNEAGIKVKIKGGFTQNLALNNYDICTIFSNAFKNAFEAVQKSQDVEKLMQLEISRQNNRWLVEIKNSVSTVVIIQNGMIATTKQDKQMHGFGIKNMKECIEKNHGMLQYAQNGSFFSTKIMI